MKIDGNEIRPGNVIEHQGRLWRAVKIQHVKPGKGGAFLQVELKEVRDGSKAERTLPIVGERRAGCAWTSGNISISTPTARTSRS